MTKGDRKAKVTPETKEEARRLRELWKIRDHPSQAEFGESYEIGNQSAVSQFLRGDTPLSLNAARGFAMGLGVSIDEFSPRLAAEAAAIANMVPGDPLSPEVAKVAAAINQLPKAQRDAVLRIATDSVEAMKQALRNGLSQKANSVDARQSSVRGRRAG